MSHSGTTPCEERPAGTDQLLNPPTDDRRRRRPKTIITTGQAGPGRAGPGQGRHRGRPTPRGPGRRHGRPAADVDQTDSMMTAGLTDQPRGSVL